MKSLKYVQTPNISKKPSCENISNSNGGRSGSINTRCQSVLQDRCEVEIPANQIQNANRKIQVVAPRLSFGRKSAPEIYQRFMDEMLEDIDGASWTNPVRRKDATRTRQDNKKGC